MNHTSTMESVAVPATPVAPSISEDWVAVGVAGVLIAAILSGGARPDPIQVSWSSGADLARIFAPANVLNWIQLGLCLLVPTVVGARLLGAAGALLAVPAAALAQTLIAELAPGRAPKGGA